MIKWSHVEHFKYLLHVRSQDNDDWFDDDYFVDNFVDNFADNYLVDVDDVVDVHLLIDDVYHCYVNNHYVLSLHYHSCYLLQVSFPITYLHLQLHIREHRKLKYTKLTKLQIK